MSKQGLRQVIECQEEVVVGQNESVVHLPVDSLRASIPGSFFEGCVEYVETEFIRNHIAFDRQQNETCQVHRAVLKGRKIEIDRFNSAYLVTPSPEQLV